MIKEYSGVDEEIFTFLKRYVSRCGVYTNDEMTLHLDDTEGRNVIDLISKRVAQIYDHKISTATVQAWNKCVSLHSDTEYIGGGGGKLKDFFLAYVVKSVEISSDGSHISYPELVCDNMWKKLRPNHFYLFDATKMHGLMTNSKITLILFDFEEI
jgi:hypothetical protein